MGRRWGLALAAVTLAAFTGRLYSAAPAAIRAPVGAKSPMRPLRGVQLAAAGSSAISLAGLSKRKSGEVSDAGIVRISLTVSALKTLAISQPDLFTDALIRKLVSAPAASSTTPATGRVLSREDVQSARPGDVKAADTVLLDMPVAVLKALAASRHAQLRASAGHRLHPTDTDAALRESDLARSEAARAANLAARIDALRTPQTATDEPGYGISCDPPKIISVYPLEVRPGDPVLIKGCGFYGEIGSAAMIVDGQERILTITKWAGESLEAKVPSFGGFAASKQVTIVVRNAQGSQSAPSKSLILVPNIRRDTLYATPYQKSSLGSSACTLDDGGYMPSTGSFSFYGVHTGTICCWPCECNGTDRFFENVQLKNNWRVVSLGINAVYDLLGAWEQPCRQGSEARALLTVENPKAGDSHIGKVSVYWYTASGYTVSYKVWVTIQGPADTSPY